MWSKNFDYKKFIERILNCPDSRLKEAKTFWSKETGFFKKLYKKYPSENFWKGISFLDCNCKHGRLSSLSVFFDKKNFYWTSVLNKKWKNFNWAPEKIKSYKFKKDIDDPPNYDTKKQSLRNFFN